MFRFVKINFFYFNLGKLKCQIMEDRLDDVDQQFNLLSEAMQGINNNPVNRQIAIY